MKLRTVLLPAILSLSALMSGSAATTKVGVCFGCTVDSCGGACTCTQTTLMSCTSSVTGTTYQNMTCTTNVDE